MSALLSLVEHDLRAQEPLRADEDTPTPILQLPTRSCQNDENRRFLPRVFSSFVGVDIRSGERYEGANLSFGGMLCFAENEPVWPGNLLHLDISLPAVDEGGPTTIPVRARVIELLCLGGRFAMRLRFEDLPISVRKNIASWMARGLGV